ncbi:aminotransferase class I/II-fold pyridoxal phosphate-dependent enzyme [Cyanobacteria bacterium FACHB-63]|nr:aminotransferase class I/II-fold pyridoxal phosphate-dependent enzyme [Cyanobacteria bacterium FACHB-63]
MQAQENRVITKVEELAFFGGGSPAFPDKLHVGRPNNGDKKRFLERAEDILERCWLTNDGPYVNELQQRLLDYTGGKHCVLMSNGTIALEIAARALGLKGEVIVPSFTFVATAHALQWQEITPVFCDVDPLTHNIDPYKVEQLITPKTTGIVGVHVWGRPCNIEALTDIAYRHNLKLMFDAAHALRCSHQGQLIGDFGEASVFSFHATKFMHTFEGGAVVTDDAQLASKMRLMKNFGFGPGYDNVIYSGTNGKMSEICAAMGLTNLESINSFIDINYDNYQHYQRELSNIPGVSLISYNEFEKNNYQYIILEIDPEQAGITRDQLVKILQAENILARRYFFPGCHNMEPYRSYFPNSKLLLPETERLTQKVLSLPTGTAVNNEIIRKICQLIRFIVQKSDEVSKLMHKISSSQM